jgi:glycosyltransferase involved in cell wall biosynthesis
MERDHAVQVLHGSHVFAITSIKDLTSTVVLEAISQGVPVVCLDHCGFADVVGDDCGLKIPIESPKQVVAGLAGAIERLGRDEPLRRQFSAAALRRIGDYSWQAKATRVNAIYQKAVDQ